MSSTVLDTRLLNTITVNVFSFPPTDISKIKELVKQGANINAQDSIGKTALINAVLANDIQAVKALIEMGADLNIQSRRGRTALMDSSLARAEQTLSNNNINQDPEADQQGLIYEDIVRVLIAAGADLNIQDDEGKTALMFAMEWHGIRMAEMLIAAGADIELTNDRGLNALHFLDTEYVLYPNPFKPILKKAFKDLEEKREAERRKKEKLQKMKETFAVVRKSQKNAKRVPLKRRTAQNPKLNHKR